MGRSLDHWREGMGDALDLLMASFAGKVSADDDLYRFREVAPAPAPLTRPHPPVYVAASSARNADLDARHGLPMLFFLLQDAAAMAPLVDRHAAATGSTPDGFRHGTTVLAHVTDTADEARALVHEVLTPFLLGARSEYVMLEEREGDHPPVEAMAEMILDSEAIGAVELCVERITARLRVPGVSRVLLHVEAAGRPEAIVANLERVATEVVPAVKDRLAG